MKKILTLALTLILVLTSLALPLNILADNNVGQNASVHDLISQETPLQNTTPQNNAPVSDQTIQSEQFQLFHDMALFQPSLTADDLPGTMTMAQANERGHIARLYNEEPDLNTVIFLNQDGTKSIYQYAAPVKYERNGSISDKSNKIIASDLSGYSYKNKSNDVDVFFADEISSSSSKGVRVINDDINIELIPSVRQSAIDNIQKEIQDGEESAAEGDVLQNQISPFSDADASQNETHAEAQTIIVEGTSETEADININAAESGASDVPAETSAASGASGSLQTGAGTGGGTESGGVFNEASSDTDAQSNNAPGNSTEAGSTSEASDSVNNQSTDGTINNDASGVNDIAGNISEDADISATTAQPNPHTESETTERKISSELLTSSSAAADSILYSKVFSDSISLRYTPTFNGFKEDIILNEYDGINSFDFILNTNGLAMIQLAGNWYLAEPGSTEPLVSLGEIYVYDSYTGQRTVESDTWEHETYNNSYGVETITENQRYRITVNVDSAFLQAASTVYPVIVDPSFTVTSAYIMDTMISQGNPNTNYGSYQDVRMGYGNTFQSTRILVDFTSYATSASDFSSLSFSSAEYYMYCSSSYSSSPCVDTYMIAAKNISDPKMWSHTTATWNNSASQTLNGATLVSSRTVSGSGWYSFDISDAYRTWISTGFGNSNGFLIKMRDETAASNYWRIFHSANYTDSTKTPYMLVKYNEVSSVTLSASNLLMYPGETYQLSWSVSPVTADYTFSYGHSSPNVVSMNSSGLITAHAAGSGGMQIYVTCSSTGKLYVLPVNVTVNSGSPSIQMATYHIFNTNSCKPVTVPGGATSNGSPVKQDNFSSSKSAYQKWNLIRLSNGYYVIRANYAKNFALSNLNSGITIYGVGNIDDPASVPSHAQWSITASASGLCLSPRSDTTSYMKTDNVSVWAGENIIKGATDAAAYYMFIKPSDYVPTTGVTLTAVYLLKNGTYTYTPTVTPSNATFANKAMWSWYIKC